MLFLGGYKITFAITEAMRGLSLFLGEAREVLVSSIKSYHLIPNL